MVEFKRTKWIQINKIRTGRSGRTCSAYHTGSHVSKEMSIGTYRYDWRLLDGSGYSNGFWNYGECEQCLQTRLLNYSVDMEKALQQITN